MSRFLELLALLALPQLACASTTKPHAGDAPALPTHAQSNCDAKAEKDAQAAHACLTSTWAAASLSASAADKVRPFLAALCPANEGERSAGQIGCAGCAPKFAASGADPSAFAEVVQFVEGSFTEPGASEALLTFAPCAAQDEGPQPIVVRQHLGQFERVDVPPLSGARRCVASRARHGYSRLVCVGVTGEDLGTKEGAESWLDVLDLHVRRRVRLAAIRSTQRAACADAQRSMLREFGVVAAGFRDLDSDGLEDVWIRALWSTGPEPPRYDALCRDVFQPRDDWMAVQAELRALACELPAKQCDLLEFVATGDGFQPSSATARTLGTLDSTASAVATTW